MRTPGTLAITLTVLLLGSAVRADETPAKGKIVAVDLFKNGLAIIKCELTLGKPGTYVLEDVPQPVHGTFWVTSPATVEAVVKLREVEVPADESTPSNLQEDLAGKKVTLHFKGGNRPPVVGTMAKLKPAKADEPVAPGRFLIIQTAKGRSYVEASEVSSVEAEDAGDKVKRHQPRLLLTLLPTDKAETKVIIRYLTHGMAWAPSYMIDITDPKMLTLEQNAVVRNELSNLDNVDMKLISGYPSVQFAHVRSLLSPRTSLATFFAELGNGRTRETDGLDNSVMTQQVALNNYRGGAVSVTLGATPAGEGVDLHYQSIGKRTLAEGETLGLTVAKGKAEYERIVEWLIPDTRNEYGQHNHQGPSENDSAWDALKFKNPLSYPMTTGPATVTSGGAFNGQRMSYWVNSGEETGLRVSKALSVRTRSIENEQLTKEGSTRDFVWVGGRQYRKVTVEGELAVSNHRKETVSMVIRRLFSGDLVTAEGSPKVSLREEGAFSINKRNALLWTMSLKPGEEKTVKYSYNVLVSH